MHPKRIFSSNNFLNELWRQKSEQKAELSSHKLIAHFICGMGKSPLAEGKVSITMSIMWNGIY